jgi:hypothetical protein
MQSARNASLTMVNAIGSHGHDQTGGAHAGIPPREAALDPRGRARVDRRRMGNAIGSRAPSPVWKRLPAAVPLARLSDPFSAPPVRGGSCWYGVCGPSCRNHT